LRAAEIGLEWQLGRVGGHPSPTTAGEPAAWFKFLVERPVWQ
jgi:hypothetical protein